MCSSFAISKWLAKHFGQNRGDIRDDVSATSDGALAGAAVPDTGRVTTDGNLSAESAGVLGVLGDFHLLHLLTEGGTVTDR
jgi:hypothetical protein